MVQINIAPTAAGTGLYESLQKEARNRGIGIRPFIRLVIRKALNQHQEFDEPLVEARELGGKQISFDVSAAEKEDLKKWAQQKGRTLSGHCSFILEKAFELANFFDSL